MGASSCVGARERAPPLRFAADNRRRFREKKVDRVGESRLSVKPFEKRGFQRLICSFKHDGPFGTAALSAHHDTVRRAMRANPSRDRAAGHAPRVSSTATRRLGSRVPPPARAAQRRASPRDVVVRPRARRAQPPTRWVEAPRRRRDAPRAQSLSFVPEGDAAPPRTALVVGAGPAGALAALYLSRLGWRVRVLDAMAGNERTNENAVVSRRGLAALRDAGVVLDPERDGATTLEGAVVYSRVPNTPNVAIGQNTNQFKGSVVLPRGALVDAIARSIRSSDESSVSLENASAAAVTFEYGKSLRFVDLDNRVAFFDDVTKCSTNDVFVEVAYDVLVGADGAESVVRGTLEREGVLKCERNADGLFAKTVALPPSWFDTHEIDWHRRRHSWPSGLVDAFATPNADGSFVLTIVAPIGFWERVRDASDAEKLLESYVPNAFDDTFDDTTDSFKQNAIEVLLNKNALHPNGVSTFCSRLTAFDGTAVLVGDAAHAAWPTLGQNMDATLETSAYLGAALERAMDTHASGGVLGGKEDDGGDENSFDVKTALTNYFERGRAPAARAYVRLCETGFGSGDVGWKRRVENFFFFAKLFVVTCLHRLLPFLFDAPALSKMDDPSWGYDDVEDETRRESGVVFGVLFSLITLVVATRRFGLKKVVESLVTTGRALLTGDANGGEGIVIVVLGSAALVTAAFRFAEKRRARKRETRRGNATRRETRVA